MIEGVLFIGSTSGRAVGASLNWDRMKTLCQN